MEGMLTGFTLQEIFTMMAATKKTGVLEVMGSDANEGCVFFNEGNLTWAQTEIDGAEDDEDPESRGPAEDLVEDAVMRIFEWHNEAYRFVVGETTDKGGKTSLAVVGALSSVSKRLAEWAEIRTEVPSMKARVDLINKLGSENVTLTAAEWAIVTMVGQTASVEELRQGLKTSQISLCRTLYNMSKKGMLRCLGEIEDADSASAKGAKKGSKKYIRKSLLTQDDLEDGVPAEWASYYKRLDSRHAALEATTGAAAVEN